MLESIDVFRIFPFGNVLQIYNPCACPLHESVLICEFARYALKTSFRITWNESYKTYKLQTEIGSKHRPVYDALWFNSRFPSIKIHLHLIRSKMLKNLRRIDFIICKCTRHRTILIIFKVWFYFTRKPWALRSVLPCPDKRDLIERGRGVEEAFKNDQKIRYKQGKSE